MREHNHNVEVMNNLKECGMITCIHCIGGYCSNTIGCELYERHLKQED
ncbi:hypothetical protein [Thermotalea metallivorans]|uniref:Uncharacterized protein n=1 Tax=Thermotalea metallivorans TaxID=520762 RepID=A0A140L8I4_9FIRM|nr:hypothetical protein [Thermotalea metallivorans]KXG76859.1 hypothetical protein AN619_08510 [Thermotalea metallivorans]